MSESDRWWNSWTAQIVSILVLDAIVVAAFWIGEGIEQAAITAAIMLAFTAFLVFGRGRSQTAEVVSGVGDERIRTLYTRAAAFTCGVMSFVIVGWFLGTVIEGEPNETLSLLGFIFGVTLLGSAAYYARRG